MSIDNVLSTIKSGVAGITFASPAEALTAVYIKPDDLVSGVEATRPFGVVHVFPSLDISYNRTCSIRTAVDILIYIDHDNKPFGSTIDAQIEAKAQAYASGLIGWYAAGAGLNKTARPLDAVMIHVNVPHTWNTQPYKMVYMSIDIEVTP